MKERLTNHINCNLIGLDNHMKHRRQTFLENFKVCCKYFEFRFWVEWTEDIALMILFGFEFLVSLAELPEQTFPSTWTQEVTKYVFIIYGDNDKLLRDSQ